MINGSPPFSCKQFAGAGGTPLFYTGPALEEGPLPGIFYFALAGDESLELDPFNQPVIHLHNSRLRVFSMTLPAHGPGFDKTVGVSVWIEKLHQGTDLLTPFFQEVIKQIDFLISSHIIDPEHLGVAGLSRGVFIAAHVAALVPRVKAILGFAPLTNLTHYKERLETGKEEILHAFDLRHLTPQLFNRNLRFYMGNHDVLVGTSTCFHFVNELVAEAVKNKIRSPQVELNIFPSIGFKGHGTPPHLFAEGADWIRRKVES
jgi:predicted esterase